MPFSIPISATYRIAPATLSGAGAETLTIGTGDKINGATAGVSVTSVSVADDYILWGDCFVDGCQVGGYDNGNVVSVPTSGPPVDVQGDAGAWYWGDSQLEKFTL